MLAYASIKRKCWAPSGGLQYFSIEELGVDHSMIELLCDQKKLDEELKILESKNFIYQHGGKLHVRHGFVVGWRQWKQMVPLVCFYFTGCEYSDRFSAIGNSALPVFQEMIKEFMQQHEDERRSCRKIILPALVQASKFSDLHWKRRCVDIVEQEGLQDLDTFTQTYFCVRQAFVLRSEGDWAASFRIVHERLALLEDRELDPRLNAVRGLLVHSLATTLWEREKFVDAASAWSRWKVNPTVPQSLFETRVSVKILTGTGKATLHQGDFVYAERSLKSALLQYEDSSRMYLDVLATLSDVYCELRNPSQAVCILRSNGIPEVSSNDRYYTNCKVSYAQALVCMRNTEEAEHILLNLEKRFAGDTHRDRHDRRRYIRVVLLLAQNLHFQAENPVQWKETVRRWTVVIESMSDFEEVSGWDFGMVFFSMHHAVLQSGATDSDWLAQGTSKFEQDGRFWMRGMTTYWHDFLLPKLPCVGIIERLLNVPIADKVYAER
jgi:hypothetical protein